MTKDLLFKAENDFKRELRSLQQNSFNYVFPFNYKNKTYNYLKECFDTHYSGNFDNREPMMYYHDEVGINLPFDLRVAIETTFCKCFPEGLFMGRSCD